MGLRGRVHRRARRLQRQDGKLEIGEIIGRQLESYERHAPVVQIRRVIANRHRGRAAVVDRLIATVAGLSIVGGGDDLLGLLRCAGNGQEPGRIRGLRAETDLGGANRCPQHAAAVGILADFLQQDFIGRGQIQGGEADVDGHRTGGAVGGKQVIAFRNRIVTGMNIQTGCAAIGKRAQPIAPCAKSLVEQPIHFARLGDAADIVRGIVIVHIVQGVLLHRIISRVANLRKLEGIHFTDAVGHEVDHNAAESRVISGRVLGYRCGIIARGRAGVEFGHGNRQRWLGGHVGDKQGVEAGKAAAKTIAGSAVLMIIIGLDEREIRTGHAQIILVPVGDHQVTPTDVGAGGVAGGGGRQQLRAQRFAVEDVHVGERRLHGISHDLEPHQKIKAAEAGAIRLVIHLVTVHIEQPA